MGHDEQPKDSMNKNAYANMDLQTGRYYSEQRKEFA